MQCQCHRGPVYFTCISPVLSMQNGSLCVVQCSIQCSIQSNVTSCQLLNCAQIYNCINGNIQYQRNNTTITLSYEQNYYLIINYTGV